MNYVRSEARRAWKGEPVRILYVEDSEDDVQLALNQLRRVGFDPIFTRVDTPSAMRQALTSGKWDLILSDYTMPCFSGRAALTVRNELAPHVPFIAVSGTITLETALEAMKHGMNDYVMKNSLSRLGLAIQRGLAEANAQHDQRQAEGEKAEERNRLNLTLSATNDVFYDWNIETGRIWHNEPVGAGFGWPVENMDRTWWLQRIHPDDRQRVEQTIGAALDLRRPKWFAKYRCQRANEEWAYVLDRAAIFYNEFGAPQRCVGSIVDLTDVCEREKEYLQAQKLDAISLLAGGIAHEFNNLLTAVIGYSDLALAELPRELNPYKHIKTVREAGERAASLTRQFLNFSRKQVACPILINLNLSILDLRAMLQQLVGMQTELRLDLETGLGQVEFDPFQVEQILVNLTANARDAMPQGGTLTIETRNVTLGYSPARIPLDLQPGPHVVLSITDTGCGMNEETQAHLFEPFFTTKQVGQGTGLGLSSVYGFVKQNRGHIEVETSPGDGTTFRIFLPRVAPAANSDQTESLTQHADQPETILVVEDDEAVRNLVCKILRDDGYRVFTSTSGNEALTFISNYCEPIHLVMTNFAMPTSDEADLAKHVETLRPNARILLLSGYQTKDDQQRPVIPKPIARDSLLIKVREALRPSPTTI